MISEISLGPSSLVSLPLYVGITSAVHFATKRLITSLPKSFIGSSLGGGSFICLTHIFELGVSVTKGTSSSEQDSTYMPSFRGARPSMSQARVFWGGPRNFYLTLVTYLQISCANGLSSEGAWHYPFSFRVSQVSISVWDFVLTTKLPALDHGPGNEL